MKWKNLFAGIITFMIAFSVSYVMGDNVIRGIYWGDIKGDIAKQTDLQVRIAASSYGGDVTGPASTTENNVPLWDSVLKKLKDGLAYATSAIANTFAVRDANGSLYAYLFYDKDGLVGSSGAQGATVVTYMYGDDVFINSALNHSRITNYGATKDIVCTFDSRENLGDDFEIEFINEIGITEWDTAYDHDGGSGNRTSTITISQSNFTSIGGAITALLDGNQTSGTSVYRNNGLAVADAWLKFDFGSAVVINEMKYYTRDNSHPCNFNGVWQWQGSNDDATWANIGGQWTLPFSANPTCDTLSANMTPYRYYRMFGISGTAGDTYETCEAEFKIASSTQYISTDITLTPAATDKFSNTLATGSSVKSSHKGDVIKIKTAKALYDLYAGEIYPVANWVDQLD